MGLLSTKVSVNVFGNMVKHYEKLGYEIPRRIDNKGRYTVPANTYINVNVKDLSNGSKVLVDIQCNHCGKIYQIRYYQYLQRVKDNKTYCASCYSKVFRSKENSPWWNFDKNEEDKIQNRHIEGYDDFIKRVLARDNYTCQCCGKYAERMEVHHLNGYNWFIEGRTDDKNAITLCQNCHGNFHSIYGYGNNTKEQFEKWIGKVLDNLYCFDGDLPTARKIYCIEEDKVYDNAKTLAEKWGLKRTNTIYNVCNRSAYPIKPNNTNSSIKFAKHYTVCGKHLIWYDEYIGMTKDEIEKYIQNSKPNYKTKAVICLTTNQVFDSISSASKTFNISKNSIIKCCKGKTKYCKDNLGNKIEWVYYPNL